MSTSSGFQGADVGAMEKVVREFTSAAQKVDQTISYVQALIVALKAASFFTGGASLAYAQYLETTVLPWLRKISMALKMAIQILRTQISDQTQASSLETLGIERLGYTTPQLPTTDARAFPTMAAPTWTGGAGTPSGSGLTSPVGPSGGVGGGTTGGAGAPGAGGIGVPVGSGHTGAGVGTGSPPAFTAAGVGGSAFGGSAFTGGIGRPAFDPASGSVAGTASSGSGSSFVGSSSVAGPAGPGASSPSGTSVGTGAFAGTGSSGIGAGSTGGGSALGATADTGGGTGSGEATSGAPQLRSRSAIGGEVASGFAGRQSIGASDVGAGDSAGTLRAAPVAASGAAGIAGLGLAGAGAAAMRKGGRRILGGDGQDLFTPGDAPASVAGER